MKYYSIDKIYGSLLADDNIIQGKNSKEALEKNLNKKVIRTENNPTYSVVECDEKGRVHYDRRKWIYYKIK
jgi:hypothetical protein